MANSLMRKKQLTGSNLGIRKGDLKGCTGLWFSVHGNSTLE